MKCPECAAENHDGKNFCSACGSLLTPQLLPVVRAQVEEYVRQHFKDQKLVENETSEAVAEKVLKWAKYYYAFPVAVLVVICALLGISDYSDFRKTVHQAKDQAVMEAGLANEQAKAAEKKAADANASIVGAMNKMNALAVRFSGREKTTEGQLAESKQQLERQLTDLSTQLQTAKETIEVQQKKLTNTNELVNAMFSQGKTETFYTLRRSTPGIALRAYPDPNLVQVFLALKSAPILQTVQVQWWVAVQPRYSYSVVHNIVIFNWGETLNNLDNHPIEVSYVPDPTYKGDVYSNLFVKDGHLIADGKQIQ
jgi:hypothetical protein